MTAAGAPARILDWDSAFFGRRIARIAEARLSREGLDRIRRWAREEAVDCLYFLADAGDSASIRLAEAAGFRLTDVRVARTRPCEAAADAPSGIEPFQARDLPALKAIARASHADSRFYNDPGFPDERCHDLYETWIERACGGRADAVLVARSGGKPAGYVACAGAPAGPGRIDLIAVAPELRGQGSGAGLVAGSLRWFAERGCSSVEVVSQARNVAAARLYESHGFRTASVGHWYHWWPALDDRSIPR